MELLLYEKWSMSDIEVSDLGLQRYVNLKPILFPHSSGRHSSQRFKKIEVNIVERFVNKLMRPGNNTGKKTMIMNAVEAATKRSKELGDLLIKKREGKSHD